MGKRDGEENDAKRGKRGEGVNLLDASVGERGSSRKASFAPGKPNSLVGRSRRLKN